MLNVGQLLREQHSSDGVVALGFGSYKGSVIAGREWGDSMRKIKVPEAVQGSWEHSFHVAGNGKNKLLLITIIAIIVISGIIYFLNSNVLPSPQKTVKDYFNYIINEDYSKAYELLTGHFKQSKGTLEEFTALFAVYPSSLVIVYLIFFANNSSFIESI